jgi:hypothetical protein
MAMNAAPRVFPQHLTVYGAPPSDVHLIQREARLHP